MKPITKHFAACVIFFLGMAYAQSSSAQSMSLFLQGLNKQMSDVMGTARNTPQQNLQLANRYNSWTNTYSGYVAQEEARTQTYQQYQQQQYVNAYYQAKQNYEWALQNNPYYARYYAQQMQLYRPHIGQ